MYVSVRVFINVFLCARAAKNLKKRTLAEKLKTWIIENKPTKASAESLLKILNEDGLKVPVSVATSRNQTLKCLHIVLFIYSFIFLSISAVLCTKKN